MSLGATLRRLLGLLLLAAAVMMAWMRTPDRPPDTLVARWAPAPSDFMAVRGQVVHLRDQGPRDDPLPIVLIHGTSASLHTWEGWAAVLQERRRVISFDLPGFGLTGPFDPDSGYTPDDYGGDTYAGFVRDLLDALQVPRAVLAGNSLGGEVAWRTAVLAPERVAALVLVDASGLSHQPEEVPAAWTLARIPVLNRISQWTLPRGLVTEGVQGVYGEPSRVTPALVDRYYELTLREGNRRALRLRLQQHGFGADADRIDALTVPTLILWGGRDRLIPPAAGEEFQRRIAGSERVVFDDLGHVPQEEDPARTLQPVLDFLQRLPP
jgi:pimeloyl-ACP methyl ester carboxylesterase